MDSQTMFTYMSMVLWRAETIASHIPKPHTAAMLVKTGKILGIETKSVRKGTILSPERKLLEERLEQSQGTTLISVLEPERYADPLDEFDFYELVKRAGIKEILYIHENPFLYKRGATHRLLEPAGIRVVQVDELAAKTVPLIWTPYEGNDKDENNRYMQQAIQLAQVTPHNIPHPHVGAVIVKDGQVIGRGTKMIVPIRKGVHSILHAERLAIEHATAPVAGATLYTTLEPCIETGQRTEMIENCVRLIVESEIKRVVFGRQDRLWGISGRGIERLMLNGVEIQRCSKDEEMNRTIDALSGKHHHFWDPHKPQRPLRSRLG